MTNNLLNEDVYLTGLLSLPFVVLSETYKNKEITSQNGYFWNIKKIVDTKRHIYAHFTFFEDKSIIKNNLVDIINLYNIHGLEIKNNIISLCKKQRLEIENEFSNTKYKRLFYIVPGTKFRELTNKDICYVDNEIKTKFKKIKEWEDQPKEYMEYFKNHLENWYKFLQVTRPISSSKKCIHLNDRLEKLKQGIKNYNLYLMYFYSLPLVHWWEVQKRPGINEDPYTEIENVLESLRNTCCHANETYKEDFIIKCLRVVRYFYKHYRIEIKEINDILEKASVKSDTQVEEKPDCFYFHDEVDFHKLENEEEKFTFVDLSIEKELPRLKGFLQDFVDRIPKISASLRKA